MSAALHALFAFERRDRFDRHAQFSPHEGRRIGESDAVHLETGRKRIAFKRAVRSRCAVSLGTPMSSIGETLQASFF